MVDLRTDGRAPPHDLEAEAAILGLLLVGHPSASVELVASTLTPEDFFSDAHGRIFGAMLRLDAAGRGVDPIAVGGLLREDERLAQVGGLSYLTDLTNGSFTVDNLETYVARVREQAAVRRAIARAQLVAAEGYVLGKDPEEVGRYLGQAAQSFADLAQSATQTKSVVRAVDVARSVLSETMAKATQGGGLAGEPSGMDELDSVLDGLQREFLIILAARPGMGKTTLALQIASYVARRRDEGPQRHALFFSLEMSRQQLARKLIASAARVNPRGLRDNSHGDVFGRALDALGPRGTFPPNLWIDDTPGQTIFGLKAAVRKKKTEWERAGDALGLVVVDYLLLLRSADRRRSESRAEEVGHFTRELKNMAAEFGVPFLVLAQLNRESVNRTAKAARPELWQLKSSGDIEQDANVVLFLWSEAEGDTQSEKKDVVLSVAKNRDGRPDVDIRLEFHGAQSRFQAVQEAVSTRRLKVTLREVRPQAAQEEPERGGMYWE